MLALPQVLKSKTMDFFTPDLPGYEEPGFPLLAQSSSVFDQPYDLQDIYSVFGSQVPGILLPVAESTFTQGYIPPSPNPYAVLEVQDATSNALEIAQLPMGPSAKTRKRKAPKLNAEAWEPHKPHIKWLHIDLGLPLKEVKERMEKEFGFRAE
jgi:Clr5 domain